MKKEYKDISQRLKPETVLAKTGQSLADWFVVLDEFGGKTKGHTAMAKFLVEEKKVGAWWAQSITVAYEYHHKLRKANQRKDGYEFSLQRTVGLTLEDAYDTFTNADKAKLWLSPYVNIDLRVGGSFNFDDISTFVFAKIVPQKLLRLEMYTAGKKSRVDVHFLVRSDRKTAIRIVNSKLAGPEKVTEYRPYWDSFLSAFQAYVKKHL